MKITVVSKNKNIKKRLCRICNEESCMSKKCVELILERKNNIKRFNKFRRYKTIMAKYKKKSCTVHVLKKHSRKIDRIEKTKTTKKAIKRHPRNIPVYSCRR